MKQKILLVLLLFSSVIYIHSCSTNTKLSTKSQEAEKYYLEGIKDLDKLYYEGAIDNFKKSFEIDPNFAMASMQIALANIRTGKEDSANYFINLSWDLIENTTRYEKLRIRYTKYLIYKEYKKLEQTTDSLLYEYPNDIEVKKINALIQFNRKNFKIAREIFLDILESSPDYYMAYNMIGYSYFNQGYNKDAHNYFKKYIEKAPNQINPYDSMAEFYTLTGKYNEAIELLENILETKKDQIETNSVLASTIYTRLSISYFNLGQLEKSLKFAKLSTMKHTQKTASKMANTTLIDYYFRQKDILGLEKEFDRIKDKINPLTRDYLEVRINLCKDNFELASEKINSIKKRQTKSSQNTSKKSIIYITNILEGELFYHQKNYDEAIEKYDIAISIMEEKYYTSLLKIHKLISMFNAGQQEEAISELECTLSRNPNDAYALFYISTFYYKMNNFEEAKYYVNHFLDQWKNASNNNKLFKKAQFIAEQIGD